MSAQQEIREANLKRIFRIILTEKSVSRAQIAHKTKLTKTTVSSLVEELLDRHFVEERIDSTVPRTKTDSNNTGQFSFRNYCHKLAFSIGTLYDFIDFFFNSI